MAILAATSQGAMESSSRIIGDSGGGGGAAGLAAQGQMLSNPRMMRA